MRPEDDQELWDLLGTRPQPEVSPFFARNVMRVLRNRQTKPRNRIRDWFSLGRLVPAGGLAAGLLAVMLFLHTPGSWRIGSRSDLARTRAGALTAQDADLAADLNDLAGGDDGADDDDDSDL